MVKQTQSRIYELKTDATNHLSDESEGGRGILCGIDKKSQEVYNISSDPITNIEGKRIHICKGCYRAWEKLNNSN